MFPFLNLIALYIYIIELFFLDNQGIPEILLILNRGVQILIAYQRNIRYICSSIKMKKGN